MFLLQLANRNWPSLPISKLSPYVDGSDHSTTRFFGSDEILEIPESLQNRLPHPDRPKCNSILHLIGSWLFEAAFIGSEYSKHPADQVAPHVNDQLTHKISLPAPSLSPKPVRRPIDQWTSVKIRLLLFF